MDFNLDDEIKQQLQNGIAVINFVTIIPRAIDVIVERAMTTVCNSTNSSKRMCSTVREGVSQVIPEGLINLTQHIHEGVTRISEEWALKYSIPQEDTRRAFYGLGVSSLIAGGGAVAATAKHIRRTRSVVTVIDGTSFRAKNLVLEPFQKLTLSGGGSMILEYCQISAKDSMLFYVTWLSTLRTSLTTASGVGSVRRTTRLLTEAAKSSGAKKAYVTFEPANSRLASILTRSRFYKGQYPLSFPVPLDLEKGCRFPVFELPLSLKISGSAVAIASMVEDVKALDLKSTDNSNPNMEKEPLLPPQTYVPDYIEDCSTRNVLRLSPRQWALAKCLHSEDFQEAINVLEIESRASLPLSVPLPKQKTFSVVRTRSCIRKCLRPHNAAKLEEMIVDWLEPNMTALRFITMLELIQLDVRLGENSYDVFLQPGEYTWLATCLRGLDFTDEVNVLIDRKPLLCHVPPDETNVMLSWPWKRDPKEFDVKTTKEVLQLALARCVRDEDFASRVESPLIPPEPQKLQLQMETAEKKQAVISCIRDSFSPDNAKKLEAVIEERLTPDLYPEEFLHVLKYAQADVRQGANSYTGKSIPPQPDVFLSYQEKVAFARCVRGKDFAGRTEELLDWKGTGTVQTCISLTGSKLKGLIEERLDPNWGPVSFINMMKFAARDVFLSRRQEVAFVTCLRGEDFGDAVHMLLNQHQKLFPFCDQERFPFCASPPEPQKLQLQMETAEKKQAVISCIRDSFSPDNAKKLKAVIEERLAPDRKTMAKVDALSETMEPDLTTLRALMVEPDAVGEEKMEVLFKKLHLTRKVMRALIDTVEPDGNPLFFLNFPQQTAFARCIQGEDFAPRVEVLLQQISEPVLSVVPPPSANRACIYRFFAPDTAQMIEQRLESDLNVSEFIDVMKITLADVRWGHDSFTGKSIPQSDVFLYGEEQVAFARCVRGDNFADAVEELLQQSLKAWPFVSSPLDLFDSFSSKEYVHVEKCSPHVKTSIHGVADLEITFPFEDHTETSIKDIDLETTPPAGESTVVEKCSPHVKTSIQGVADLETCSITFPFEEHTETSIKDIDLETTTPAGESTVNQDDLPKNAEEKQENMSGMLKTLTGKTITLVESTDTIENVKQKDDIKPIEMNVTLTSHEDDHWRSLSNILNSTSSVLLLSGNTTAAVAVAKTSAAVVAASTIMSGMKAFKQAKPFTIIGANGVISLVTPAKMSILGLAGNAMLIIGAMCTIISLITDDSASIALDQHNAVMSKLEEVRHEILDAMHTYHGDMIEMFKVLSSDMGNHFTKQQMTIIHGFDAMVTEHNRTRQVAFSQYKDIVDKIDLNFNCFQSQFKEQRRRLVHLETSLPINVSETLFARISKASIIITAGEGRIDNFTELFADVVVIALLESAKSALTDDHVDPTSLDAVESAFLRPQCSVNLIRKFVGASQNKLFNPEIWIAAVDLLLVAVERQRHSGVVVDVDINLYLGQIEEQGRHMLLFHQELQDMQPQLLDEYEQKVATLTNVQRLEMQQFNTTCSNHRHQIHQQRLLENKSRVEHGYRFGTSLTREAWVAKSTTHQHQEEMIAHMTPWISKYDGTGRYRIGFGLRYIGERTEGCDGFVLSPLMWVGPVATDMNYWKIFNTIFIHRDPGILRMHNWTKNACLAMAKAQMDFLMIPASSSYEQEIEFLKGWLDRYEETHHHIVVRGSAGETTVAPAIFAYRQTCLESLESLVFNSNGLPPLLRQPDCPLVQNAHGVAMYNYDVSGDDCVVEAHFEPDNAESPSFLLSRQVFPRWRDLVDDQYPESQRLWHFMANSHGAKYQKPLRTVGHRVDDGYGTHESMAIISNEITSEAEQRLHELIAQTIADTEECMSQHVQTQLQQQGTLLYSTRQEVNVAAWLITTNVVDDGDTLSLHNHHHGKRPNLKVDIEIIQQSCEALNRQTL